MQLSQLISPRTIPGLFCPHPTPPTPPFAPRTAPAPRTHPHPPPPASHTYTEGSSLHFRYPPLGEAEAIEFQLYTTRAGEALRRTMKAVSQHTLSASSLVSALCLQCGVFFPPVSFCITEVDFLLFLVLVFVDAKNPT